MKNSRGTEEQIIGVLREQEAGAATAEVCRRHGIVLSVESEVRRHGLAEEPGERELAAGEAAGGVHAGYRGVEASIGKKLRLPAARRRALRLVGVT